MANFQGGEFLVTGTATSLATALGITDPAYKYATQIILRNDPAAANDAFVGGSAVTTTTNRGLILKAADAYPSYIEGSINLGEVFLVGTAAAGNIIHIGIVRQ